MLQFQLGTIARQIFEATRSCKVAPLCLNTSEHPFEPASYDGFIFEFRVPSVEQPESERLGTPSASITCRRFCE